MKKLKHLFLSLLMFIGGSNLWAQTDVTATYITNADFSSTEGWTNYSGGGTEHNEGAGLIGTLSLNSKTSTTDDTHLATEYCFGFSARWNGRYTYYQQTLSELQVGHYTLSYDVQDVNTTSTKYSMDNHFYVKVGETKYSDSATEWMEKGASGWTKHTISFVITETSEATISFGYGNKENKGSSDCPALYVSHLNLTVVPFATANDYAALNAAIEAVEKAGVGFDAGEYAPYNVATALAAAKAIDQTADNAQTEVQAATAALTAVAANTDEVNAIWDPTFEYAYSTSGNVQPIAWTGTSGHNNATDVRWMWNVEANAGLAAVSSSKALFTKYGVFYGQQSGYELPLNADTYYTLAFKYGGWSDCKKDGYVTMTDPENASLSLVATNRLPLDAVDGNANTESWKEYSGIFKTNAAGNYVLGLRKDNESVQSQYGYGDFMLKATTVAEATAYFNAVKAEVEPNYSEEANGASEKTAFKAALDAEMPAGVAEIMAAAAELKTLNDAFVAATPKYDAWVAAKATTVPALAYAAAAKKTVLEEAIAATEPTTAAEAEAATAAVTTALRAYYESHAMAEGATGAVNMDAAVAAANAGTNTGWTNGLGTNHGEGYTDAAGTVAGSYLDGGWSTTAGVNIDMTREVNVPAGTYLLTVTARGASALTEYSLSIGGQTVNLPTNSSVGGVFGRGWDDVSVEFESDGKPLTLEVKATSEATQQWISINRFRLVQLSYNAAAYASDYTALNAAIADAEAKVLGFEVGQYAPYNNVAALEALATAKAIDQSATDNLVVDVTAATDALTGATWTANDADVDAVYNGASIQDRTGWTVTSWGTNEDDAYYFQPGDLKYGTTGVYTMPLAANTLYKLTFSHSRRDQDYNLKVSVLNGEDGLAATSFSTKTSWTEEVLFFTTGEAGNYVLNFNTNKNVKVKGVSLVKAVAEDVTLDETEAYTPAKNFANVTLKRTVKAGNWNTFVVPFALDEAQIKAAFGENVEISEILADTESEEKGLQFVPQETLAIAANQPVIIKTDNDIAEMTFNGVMIEEGTPAKTLVDGVQLVGNYGGEVAMPFENDYDFFYIAANQLKKSTGEQKIRGFRAYFQVAADAPAEVKTFFESFNFGEVTGINTVERLNSDNTAIYDIQGRRVQNPTRGLYIINGKKVVIK